MNLANHPYNSIYNRGATGTFRHMFWDCPTVQQFWMYVIRMLCDLTGLHFDLDPCLLFLNDDSMYLFSLCEKLVLMAGITAANK